MANSYTGCCPKCGEHLEGDGYTTVLYCPNADDAKLEYLEPDADPVYCSFGEEAGRLKCQKKPQNR